MNPAIAAAVIQGGTQLVGGAMNGKGNSRAVRAQTAASDKALAFSQDNEKRRREEYDRAEALAKAQHDAIQAREAPYYAAKEALMRQAAGRMGLSIGEMGSRAPSPYGGPSAPSLTDRKTPRTLSEMAGTGYIPPDDPMAPTASIGNIFDWGTQRRTS